MFCLIKLKTIWVMDAFAVSILKSLLLAKNLRWLVKLVQRSRSALILVL